MFSDGDDLISLSIFVHFDLHCDSLKAECVTMSLTVYDFHGCGGSCVRGSIH